MEIYSVGCDELDDWDWKEIEAEKYIWTVYWYESGCYEGSGEAVTLGKDGLLYCKDLGHCSCYGPMEDWETGCSVMTVEEFLREKDNIHDYDCKEVVKDKVRSLLS